MKTSFTLGQRFLSVTLIAAGCLGWPSSWLIAAESAPVTARIVSLAGTAEILTPGATRWLRTATNETLMVGDQLRVGPNSRVLLHFSNQGEVNLDALAQIEVLQPARADTSLALRLLKGILSFFHRGKPGRTEIFTPSAPAGVDGTEFVIAVDGPDSERTTLSVIDGMVRFGNEPDEILVTSGQQAVAELGKRPVFTAGFIANNVLQWCFYYPAVLDLGELPLDTEAERALAASLAAYREGDLLAALAAYPAGRPPQSDAERVYHAALLLSVGQVATAETLLTGLTAGEPADPLQRLANALRQLIAAVKFQPMPATLQPALATELLAASYYEQSRSNRPDALALALALAERATAVSPEFSFAWSRVAELEFSFGRIDRARDALARSLELAPRNAQALALMGFLSAANNRTRDAINWFEKAIAVDGALGNAWLGRGLCRIRRGDRAGGREDLLIAAALEPQRALLRSYLGKAYGDAGDAARAEHELDLAKQLDPNDPTSWLYSALELEQQNRVNEAVADLERSQELNSNRQLYRSNLLLDQDQAVRSANLARIYQDAGMTEVAFREASRAVSYDYANYSSHLFLANSYNALRDPKQINLRYETPTMVEYLVANLLAPVGAGTLSTTISQQEYSKMFERDRFGLISSTEYSSGGDWVQYGEQHGTFGDFSYSLDAFYRSENGQRPNNDMELRQFSLQMKQQLTPQDSVYALVAHDRVHFSGPHGVLVSGLI